MIIWLIGMSGAGRNDYWRGLFFELKRSDPSTVFVDGDVIREILIPYQTIQLKVGDEMHKGFRNFASFSTHNR